MTTALRILACLVVAACLAATDSTGPVTRSGPATRSAVVHIVLAGDSTVTTKVGWGTGFAAAMSPDVDVINIAESGRSTKSYVDEGWWKKVLATHADYVLIQFGHNDQKTDVKRHTDPATTYRQYLNRFIDEAQAAGMKPVLVTSLGRRDWGKNGDGKIHSTLVDYAAAVKAVAAQRNVPVVDLHAASIQLYERVGKTETDAMSPVLKTGIDNTHLNEHGSAVIGHLVAAELARSVPSLARFVTTK
jgi:lysophospholipase L1-like esterase